MGAWTLWSQKIFQILNCSRWMGAEVNNTLEINITKCPKSVQSPKLTRSRSCPNLISLDSSLDDNLAAKLHCYKSTQLKKAPTANLRIRSSKTLAQKNRQLSNRVPRLCTRYGWVSGWGPTCGAVSFLVG